MTKNLKAAKKSPRSRNRKTPSGTVSSKTQKNTKKPQRSWTFRLFYAFFTLGLWGGLATLVFLFSIFFTLPDPVQAIEEDRRAPNMVLLDRHGEPFYRLKGYAAKPVHLKDMPPLLPQAFLSIEDRRFYDHFGLDPMGIIRAAYHNIRQGKLRQGGSTITQQVAKNLFLTPERTLYRKLQEMLLSFWLESTFSKEQILEIYLNRIYLGSGVYGIASAAQQYFGKHPADLELSEIALLAGLPKAPSRYSPLANPTAASKRAMVVLRALEEQKVITHDEASAARKPLNNPQNLPLRSTSGAHFHRWIFRAIENLDIVGSGDLVIETTFDATLQATIEQQLQLLHQTLQQHNVGQAAVVSIDKTGAVRAMVGSLDWKQSEFNRAVQAHRQMGSVFKIIVYAAALESGFSPDSILDTSQPKRDHQWWPEDSSKREKTFTLREGMARSSNAMAVMLSERVGRKNIISMARRMGISATIPNLPSMALGVAEIPLIEMTSAMTVIASGGLGTEPYGIRRITDKAGNIIYEHSARHHRVFSASISEQMDDMLSSVLQEGTGRSAKSPSARGGKTGTTQNHRDALFIGYGEDLVTGIWLGNDNGQSMKGVSGGSLPAKIFFNVSSIYLH